MITLGEAARRTGRARSSLRRALQLGRIAGHKTAAGEWEVDEASLSAAYPPPGDDPRQRRGSSPGSAPGSDALIAALRDSLARERDSLEREREINRALQAELERERDDRAADRTLFRELAEQWKRQLPPPAADAADTKDAVDRVDEPPRRRWWRIFRP